jgi:hypothetical protein
MTVLRITCHNCQTTLVLRPRDLVLAVQPDEKGKDDPEVLYGCRVCGQADAATIDWRVATNLTLEGIATLHARIAREDAPLELTDPARTQTSPLSLDDLLDLHEQLIEIDKHGLG